MKLVTGDPLELVCKAAGIPAPRYQWFYKDDEGIKRIPGQVNPTLHISNPRLVANPELFPFTRQRSPRKQKIFCLLIGGA